jgi:hypothetical protein
MSRASNDNLKNNKTKKDNIRSGQQGTHEPLQRPGQSSQNPEQSSPDPPPRTQEDNKTA